MIGLAIILFFCQRSAGYKMKRTQNLYGCTGATGKENYKLAINAPIIFPHTGQQRLNNTSGIFGYLLSFP